MPYYPVEVPPGTHPNLERFVRDQIDPLLREVHAMFMLPIEGTPGLDAKCHFLATAGLLGVVSGVSVTLYQNPSLSGLSQRGQRGEAFRTVLTSHYPWDEEPEVEGAIRELDAAKVLYDAFRNPLSHSLGVLLPDEDAGHGQRKVAKGALPDGKIETIELAQTRPPAWTSPTLRTDSPTKAARTKTVLNLKLFYWGVRRMIWRVIEARMASNAPALGETLSISHTATAVPSTVLRVRHIEGGSPK